MYLLKFLFCVVSITLIHYFVISITVDVFSLYIVCHSISWECLYVVFRGRCVLRY